MRRLVIIAIVLAASVVPVRADGPGDPIEVLFTEASVYSLPNIVVNHKFEVAESQTIVCNGPNPQLVIRFRTVDHSHGTNVDAHMDFVVEEDRGFPNGDHEDWETVHELKRVTSNVAPDIRRVSEKFFSVSGVKNFEVMLSYAQPVKRLRVTARAKMFNPITSILIRKPLDTAQSTESRTFYLAMRPKWGTHVHESNGLVRALRALLGAKGDLIRWRDAMVRVLLANRSLKDSAEFTPDDLSAVLRAPLKAREDLETTVSELLADGSRAAGQPPERLDVLKKDLLGVPRLPFSYPAIHTSLAERTPSQVAEAGPLRNILVTSARLVEDAGLKDSVARSIADIDRQLKALFYLWGTADRSELRSLLSAFDRTLRDGASGLARLSVLLDDTLGRDSSTGSWRPIEKSSLVRRFFPREAASDAPRAGMLLRGIYSDLLYLVLEIRFQTDVLDAMSRVILEKLGQPQGLDRLVPEPDLAFPPDLWVNTPDSNATIRPGQLAQFAFTVENRSPAEREVRVEEVPMPPEGWHSKLTQEGFRLRPGETTTVHYTLGAPYYAHVPMNHVSTLRIGWADEPGLVHQPQFLTRLTVGGKLAPLPGPVERSREARECRPTPPGDGLLVSTRQVEDITIAPGSVGRYMVQVIHKGQAPRSVSMKLMTPVPDRWLVDIKPEEAVLEPEVPTRFAMRITAPLDVVHARTVDLLTGIGYTDEFSRVDRLAFRTARIRLAVSRPRPLVNGGEVRTYYARRDAATTLMVELTNVGSVDDTFDLFIDQKPKDWYVHLDRTYVKLPNHRQPVMLPITVRPPLGALTGEFERLVLRAVSATHPEIATRQAITIASRGNPNFALEPVRTQYLVSPGTTGTLEFVARNVMDRPEKFAFKISPETIHSEWVHLDEPIVEVAPEAEVRLKVRVEMPQAVPVGERFPVVVMALDEHGGEIVAARTDLVVIPPHAIHIEAVRERIVRTRTFLKVPLVVTNSGSVDESVGLLLEGKRRYWGRLSHKKLFLRPGGRFEVVLTVRVPVEVQYGQNADITVQATSLKDGSARDFVRIGIDPPHMIRTNVSSSDRVVRF